MRLAIPWKFLPPNPWRDMSKKYEYRIMAANKPLAPEEQLNEFGNEGWRLVQIVKLGRNKWAYCFLRDVKEP